MLGEIGVAEEREVKWLESWASSDEEEVLVGLGAFRLSAMAAKRWVCQALLLYNENKETKQLQIKYYPKRRLHHVHNLFPPFSAVLLLARLRALHSPDSLRRHPLVVPHVSRRVQS